MIAKVWNVVLACLVAAAAFLAVAFGAARFIGLTPYAVLSGSMEPEFPVGSLIYVRSVDPADVRPGDAITFRLDSGTLVTHEVFKVDGQAREFCTRGIANVDGQGNISPDAAPVPWSSLVGRVVACVPLLGYVNVFVTQPPGVFVVISAAAVVVAVSVAIELAQMRRRERQQERSAPKHMR